MSAAARTTARQELHAAAAELRRLESIVTMPLTTARRDNLKARIGPVMDQLIRAHLALLDAEPEAEPLPGVLAGHAQARRIDAILAGRPQPVGAAA